MNPCNRPEGHTGRCRNRDGISWENNHDRIEKRERERRGSDG